MPAYPGKLGRKTMRTGHKSREFLQIWVRNRRSNAFLDSVNTPESPSTYLQLENSQRREIISHAGSGIRFSIKKIPDRP